VARRSDKIIAIDLYCGAGGLSYGLQEAGLKVAAGFDLDPNCEYPFQQNIEAPFLQRDVRELTAAHLEALWPKGCVRVLAGCAPCQPFSPHRRGADTSDEDRWSLLSEFGRLVAEALPTVITMENVPRLAGTEVFTDFIATLDDLGYFVNWRSCHGPYFGLAQNRRRLVLLASRLGPIEVPLGNRTGKAPTVREVIGDLPPIAHGGFDPGDPLHKARHLTDVNLARLRASSPGGTWEEWPEELRAQCHRRRSGATFRNVYARMEWDKPSPTITTLAHNFGTGRFGHPTQDRAISLREASMLQGFPRDYAFVRPSDPIYFTSLGRLIGNAVPPPLGRVVGSAIIAHVARRQPFSA
jgi:DNA (cytosine-5)-methyltransferase 1